MNTTNKNNKRNNANKSRDVAGVICIIVSSFFLICLVTPLLSDIGTFIKNLTTGLLGYMSYPIVLCTLFYGILLLMNKKAGVTGKQVALIIVMAVCAILILQTALDFNDGMKDGYGSYLSALFAFDSASRINSAGGVIFGIIAYGIKAILTVVGAFILYSLLFLVFAGLLVFDFTNKKSTVVKVKQSQSLPFVKGKNAAQPVRDVNDTSLFVATIKSTNKVSSQSGDFASIYTAMPDNFPRYDEPNYEEPAKNQERDEERERAKSILYGNTEQMLKNYEDQVKGGMNIGERVSGRSNYLIDDSVVFQRPQNTVTPPSVYDISYDGSVKYNEPKVSPLPDVAFPPEKDISDQYNYGPILNGDEISQALKKNIRTGRAEEIKESSESMPGLPPIITGNPIIRTEVKNENAVDDTLPPIISGKSIVNDEPKTEEKIENTLPPIISGDPIIKDEPKDEPKAEEVLYQSSSSIINGDDFSLEEEKAPSDFDSVVRSIPNIEDIEFEFEGSDESDNETPEQTEYFESEVSAEDSTSFISAKADAEREIEDYNTNDEEDSKVMEEDILAIEPTYQQDDDADEESFEATDNGSEEVIFDESSNFDEIEIESDDTENEVAERYNNEVSAEDEDIGNEIQAKIPDSLKLIEETVDMSETTEEVEDDNTGYYVREGFNKNVQNYSIKLRDDAGIKKDQKDNNQLHMEDYDVEIPEKPKKKKKHTRYTPPPIDYLINTSTGPDATEDYEQNAKDLEEVLQNLNVEAKVINVMPGPAVTRYELELPLGQSVKRITTHADDIAYSLAANGSIRIEAPIKGKRAVGVEVPNQSIAIVSLREIIDSKEFEEAKSCLTLALGKDITGNIKTCNLEKMPHLLIAGTTGSGKSACLNSIIMSILYKASPDDVRLILVDPKQVEFVLYRDMPHLLMKNIINDSTQAINAFKWAREEMERRYTLFAKYSVRNLADFNDSLTVKTGVESKLPRIVIIVDELADLMLAKNAKELEQHTMSLAQKARAAGVHLILATQRPSVDVLTGTIKANFPSRIAFAVKSMPDSKTILDQVGAETLLGRGDMLYAPIDSNDPIRVQGAYITTEEIENIVNFVRSNNEADYDEAAESIIMKKQEEIVPIADDDSGADLQEDPLMKDVLRRVLESGQASASQIQRRFAVGYNRASRIIDQMEENGYIGPLDGQKSRKVYITWEKFIEIYGEDA